MVARPRHRALLLLGGGSGPAERPVTAPGRRRASRCAGRRWCPPGPGPSRRPSWWAASGPSDRDGGFGGGAVYATGPAEGLARARLVVLRYDKRGIGGSDGPALSWLDARPLAADAAAAVRLLSAIPGIDTRRVTLVGHSQGGDLAFAAARRSPATRIVSLSAPGRPLGLLPRAAGAASRFLRRLVGPGGRRRDPRRATPCATPPRARQPALLVQGTADRTVPFADMARLAARAPRRGAPHPHAPRCPARVTSSRSRAASPCRVLDAIAAFAA